MKNNKAILGTAILGILGVFTVFHFLEQESTLIMQKQLLDKELEKQYVVPVDDTVKIEEVLLETITEKKVLLKKVEKQEIEVELKISEIPETFDTQLPFHSQSPLETWGEIFRETCEEASVLLAYSYFHGPHLDAETFRSELIKIVDWEKEVFGRYDHTNVEETAQILKQFYNYDNYRIVENPTVTDMKQYISDGALILAPFYGVGMNPYYSGIGPEYHFMLIKGYTKETFITHDVGTKRGGNYHYEIDTIMDRLHDYDSESIQNGLKKIIVVQS